MTGTFEHFLSLAVVCLISYMTAHLLKSEPIYESLLGRILAKNGLKHHDGPEHKVLRSFSIGTDSMACGKQIKEIDWPDHCLIIMIQRGNEEIITKGNTIIHPGDTLVAFVDENYLGMVTETIQLISGEIQMP